MPFSLQTKQFDSTDPRLRGPCDPQMIIVGRLARGGLVYIRDFPGAPLHLRIYNANVEMAADRRRHFAPANAGPSLARGREMFSGGRGLPLLIRNIVRPTTVAARRHRI